LPISEIVYMVFLDGWMDGWMDGYLCCASLCSDPGIVRLSSCPWNKRITCPPRRNPTETREQRDNT